MNVPSSKAFSIYDTALGNAIAFAFWTAAACTSDEHWTLRICERYWLRYKAYFSVRAVCFFCKGDAKAERLHEFTTFNADKSVKVMAAEMNDTDLSVKLTDGDLVAIEAKYHLAHLTIGLLVQPVPSISVFRFNCE